MVRIINGDPILPQDFRSPESVAPATFMDIAAERDFQFCHPEVLVLGSSLPVWQLRRGPRCIIRWLRGRRRDFDILKIHVHTTPRRPSSPTRAVGECHRAVKAETCARSTAAEPHRTAQVAVVVDSSHDLSDAPSTSIGLRSCHCGDVRLIRRIGIESTSNRPSSTAGSASRDQLPTHHNPRRRIRHAFRVAREEAEDVVGSSSPSTVCTVASAQAAVSAAGWIVSTSSTRVRRRSGSASLALARRRAANEVWGAAAIAAD